MTGKVIGFYENTATVEIQDSYEFKLNEQVEIESLKMSHFRELQCLYWVLINYIIDSKQWSKLPIQDRKYFSEKDDCRTLAEKLYCLVRYQTNYLVISYDPEGRAIYTPRSVSSRESSKKALSDHFNDVVIYLGKFCNLDKFWKDNSEAGGKRANLSGT